MLTGVTVSRQLARDVAINERQRRSCMQWRASYAQLCVCTSVCQCGSSRIFWKCESWIQKMNLTSFYTGWEYFWIEEGSFLFLKCHICLECNCMVLLVILGWNHILLQSALNPYIEFLLQPPTMQHVLWHNLIWSKKRGDHIMVPCFYMKWH